MVIVKVGLIIDIIGIYDKYLLFGYIKYIMAGNIKDVIIFSEIMVLIFVFGKVFCFNIYI